MEKTRLGIRFDYPEIESGVWNMGVSFRRVHDEIYIYLNVVCYGIAIGIIKGD